MNKIKRNKFFGSIVVIIALFMAGACEKENTSNIETLSLQNTISDSEVLNYMPEVVDGRLVFEDTTSFRTYKRWIYENQSNPEKIHELNKSIGFVSMKEIFKTGIELLEENRTEGLEFIQSYPNVFHEVEYDNSIIFEMQAINTYAYIANKDGVFQWGQNIDRFTHNNYYSIKDGDCSSISAIVNAIDLSINSKNITARALLDETKSEQQTSYNNVYFDSKRKTRVTARLVMGYTGYEYYYGAITNTQQKIGVWIGKKLSTNGAKITAVGHWNTNNSIYFTDTDNQTASVVYYEETSLPNFTTSSCQTTHRGVDKNGVVKNFVHANAFQPIY